jgi:hypothetical protein
MFQKPPRNFPLLPSQVSITIETLQKHLPMSQKLVITNGQRNPNVFQDNLKKAAAIKLSIEGIGELKKVIFNIQRELQISIHSQQFQQNLNLLRQIANFFWRHACTKTIDEQH